MTPTQFRTALDRLGISQAGFARSLGENERTIRRWSAGDGARGLPKPVAILVRLLTAGKITVADLER